MRHTSALAIILAASCFLCAETFPNPRLIPATSDPAGVYVTDLNNDGRPDIVYGSFNNDQPYGTPRSLYVLLAQADGTYQLLPPITLTANTTPDCVPVDVNGDKKIDLVCSEYTGQITGTTYYYARTLLGNGDGTFQSPIISSFGQGQGFKVGGAADFNHDGNMDLAVSFTNTYGSGFNEILRGDGTGHFTTVTTPSFTLPTSVQDANNDGWPDILNYSGPFAFLNKGDGTFANPSDPNIYFVGCVYGDIDNDGKVDAVCSSLNTTPAINVIRGNGDGTFDVAHPVLTIPTLAQDFGRSLKLLDLNHDGLLDIVAFSANGLTTFLGKGNLQFNNATRYNLPGTNDQFAQQHPYDFADVNGDGNYDIVASAPDGIYITYGRADGTFNATQNFATATGHTATTAADFTSDGLVDVITFSTPDLYLWANKGDGSPGVPQKIDIGSLSLTTAPSTSPFLTGDFNGDGKKDLIMYGIMGSGTTQPYLLRGKGDGSFATPSIIPNVTSNDPIFNGITEVADLNADGRDDVVRTDLNYIYSKLSQPDGSFAPQVTSALTPQYISSTTPPFVTADFDHDGKMDVAVAFQNIFIHRGNGDGTFGAASAPITVPYKQGYEFVADMKVGDFDGDDNPDLAVLFYTGAGSSDLAVYYGDGTGSFTTPVHLQFSSRAYGIAMIADLDGDGRSDLVLSYDMTYYQNYSLAVVHALDNRTFGPLKNYMIGRNNPFLVLPIDLNRDGFNDLLVSTSSTARTVLLNDPGPVVGRALSVQPEPSAIGQAFNLNALLTPPSGSTTMPTGTISFFIDRVPAGTAVMTNGAATLAVSPTLSLGSHKVTAYWPGDSNYPSIIFSTTHVATLIPVTISSSGLPASVTVGDSVRLNFSFSNAVASPSFPPTGSYLLLEGATQIGSGTITATNNSFSLNNTLLSAGTHIFTMKYSGDATHSTSTATVSVTANPASTVTSFRSSATPAPYGQTITFTITITPGVATGAGELLSSGTSTLTLTGLAGGPVILPVVFPAGSPGNTPAVITYSPGAKLLPGTYPLTATFSGDANLVSSSATLSQVVIPPPSTTTLTLSPTPSYANHVLTLTANAAGIISTPTGSVQLMDGTTMLATLTLANGSASFSTRTLTPGSHSFTATYSGDTNNAPSTGALAVSVLPYDFGLTATPTSATLSRGTSGTVTLTANSIGNFAEGISFSVTGQPASLTVTIAPAPMQLTAGATNAATLTIAGTSTAELEQHGFPLKKLGASLIAALLPFSLIRRRRRLLSLLTTLFALSLIAGIAGCSSGTSGPETYTLQITGTSDQTAITHTLSIPVTITK